MSRCESNERQGAGTDWLKKGMPQVAVSRRREKGPRRRRRDCSGRTLLASACETKSTVVRSQTPATPGARSAASAEQHTFDAEADDDVVGVSTPTQDPRRSLEATFSPAVLGPATPGQELLHFALTGPAQICGGQVGKPKTAESAKACGATPQVGKSRCGAASHSNKLVSEVGYAAQDSQGQVMVSTSVPKEVAERFPDFATVARQPRTLRQCISLTRVVADYEGGPQDAELARRVVETVERQGAAAARRAVLGFGSFDKGCDKALLEFGDRYGGILSDPTTTLIRPIKWCRAWSR